MVLRRCLALAALAALLLAPAGVPVRAAEDRGTATLAHIKLTGDPAEEPAQSEPLFGLGGENFKSKLDRIRQAKEAKGVQGLLLEIDDLTIGWGKTNELRQAVLDFRKSGKKAYAYLPSGDTRQYLLATACDEIVVPESGWLMLTGIRAEMSFYKDLFDKIGVRADMLQMGRFKGAAEPFTRTSMSKEFRAQYESVLDDLYQHALIGGIVHGRAGKNLSADEVRKRIDEGPYTARGALKAGLIDRVAYLDELPRELKGELKAQRVTIDRDYNQAASEGLKIGDPFDLLKMFNPVKALAMPPKPNIAVIYATGVIVTGKSGQSLLEGHVIGSTMLIEAIRQAEDDETVKAIVLRVDSPGGSALASDLIWNELRRCKKPVIASMSDTAASGGYYISMGARKVYAEPGTLTGSIGVVGGKLALSGLFHKVGITTETISRGANANLMSATAPFTEAERKSWSGLMHETYDQFLDRVSQNRRRAGKEKLTKEELEENLAGGRIWTGRQAKENGLVDELGTLADALAEAKKMAKLPADAKLELLELPKPKGLLETLLDLKEDSLAPGLRDLPELTRKLGAAGALLRLRGEPVWLIAPYGVEVR
jgi:protease-4